MNPDDVKWLTIPGFPKYQVNRHTLAVRSFHKTSAGMTLCLTKSGSEFGYKLYERGAPPVFHSTGDLKVIIEREKLREVRNEMNFGKSSLSGTVQTGDYIVGSIRKADGVFSTSQSPARHISEALAKAEAARLAAIDKSKKYVVLNVKAIASVQDISWE